MVLKKGSPDIITSTNKTHHPEVSLILQLFYFQGKQYLKIESGFADGSACLFDLVHYPSVKGTLLEIGNNCNLGDYNQIAARGKSDHRQELSRNIKSIHRLSANQDMSDKAIMNCYKFL